MVLGPFSLQAEYVLARVDSDTSVDPSFSAFYVTAAIFVTGESRPYKKFGGAFGRVKPENDFDLDGEGWGAFEVAVRYSMIDLNDETIIGGEVSNVSVGVNWYLTDFTRVMLNAVFVDLDNVGNARALMFRFQIDF